jgi:hypothetical protein
MVVPLYKAGDEYFVNFISAAVSEIIERHVFNYISAPTCKIN